jgi:pre-rRNA-processing protein IPI3
MFVGCCQTGSSWRVHVVVVGARLLICRSDHTLAVTGLHIAGGGARSAPIIASSSADRTVKLHALHTGALLAVAVVPAAATCVVVDAGEHVLYAGGADGVVYEVSLVGEAAAAGAGEAGAALGSTALEVAALAVGGAAGGVASLRPHARLAGHTHAVTALAMSEDGELLVSGGWQ